MAQQEPASLYKNNFPDGGLGLYSSIKQYDKRGWTGTILDQYSLHLPKQFLTDVRQHEAIYSKRGTIRGLQLQHSPRTYKFITVLQGKAKCVVLDVKPKSETYGKVSTYILQESSQYGLFVPYGYAFGFQALKNTLISLSYNGFYHQRSEICVNPFSEEIINHWDLEYNDGEWVYSTWLGFFKHAPRISARDKTALHFKDLHTIFQERVT